MKRAPSIDLRERDVLDAKAFKQLITDAAALNQAAAAKRKTKR